MYCGKYKQVVIEEVNEYYQLLDELDTTTHMEQEVARVTKWAVRRIHKEFRPKETGYYGDMGGIRDHRGSEIKRMFVPRTSDFYNN